MEDREQENMNADEQINAKENEQYYKNTESTLNRSLILCAVIFGSGVILFLLYNRFVGGIIGAMGRVLLAMNLKMRIQTKRALDSIPDQEEFQRQMDSKTCQNYDSLRLMLLDDYAVSTYSGLAVYKYGDIEKVEKYTYGSATSNGFCILLYMKDGKKNKLAIVDGVDKPPQIFETAYKNLEDKVTLAKFI